MDEEQKEQEEVEKEGKTMDLEKDKRDKLVSSIIRCIWLGCCFLTYLSFLCSN